MTFLSVVHTSRIEPGGVVIYYLGDPDLNVEYYVSHKCFHSTGRVIVEDEKFGTARRMRIDLPDETHVVDVVGMLFVEGDVNYGKCLASVTFTVPARVPPPGVLRLV